MSNLLRKACQVEDLDQAKRAMQRKNSQETQYSKQLGKDILEYGIFSSRSNDRGETNETDGCNPPTKNAD